MKAPCLKLHFETKATVASAQARSSSGNHQLSKGSLGRHLGKLVLVKVSKAFDTVLHHVLVPSVFSLEAEQSDGKIPSGGGSLP